MISICRSALAISMLVVTIPGCSSTPSERQIRSLLEEEVSSESAGRLRLASFAKINGREAEMMGIRSYIIDWEGEIEVLESTFWESPYVGRERELSFATEPSDGVDFAKRWDLTFTGYEEFSEGHLQKIRAVMTLQDSDNGWIIVDNVGSSLRSSAFNVSNVGIEAGHATSEEQRPRSDEQQTASVTANDGGVARVAGERCAAFSATLPAARPSVLSRLTGGRRSEAANPTQHVVNPPGIGLTAGVQAMRSYS
jgi:hypothetical protein